jgi:sec-independent protein translocase protein TatC
MHFLRKNRSSIPYTGDPDEYRLTLVEHLEELRDRIIRSLLIITVGSVIGWIAFPYIWDFLTLVVENGVNSALPKGTSYSEAVFNASDFFFLKLKLSFQIGVILSFPFLVLELWGFIAPALKPKEQAPFKRLAPLSLILFLMGAGFCWFILPSAIAFFVQFAGEFRGVEIKQEAGKMIFFVLKMMLAFGICFQLPLVVYALGMLELLTAETLVKYWRQVFTAIFIGSAIITPSGDAFTMAMMGVPMFILFLISAWAVKITQNRKKREREMDEQEQSEIRQRAETGHEAHPLFVDDEPELSPDGVSAEDRT